MFVAGFWLWDLWALLFPYSHAISSMQSMYLIQIINMSIGGEGRNMYLNRSRGYSIHVHIGYSWIEHWGSRKLWLYNFPCTPEVKMKNSDSEHKYFLLNYFSFNKI